MIIHQDSEMMWRKKNPTHHDMVNFMLWPKLVATIEYLTKDKLIEVDGDVEFVVSIIVVIREMIIVCVFMIVFFSSMFMLLALILVLSCLVFPCHSSSLIFVLNFISFAGHTRAENLANCKLLNHHFWLWPFELT